ncbi:MAG: lysylphosphatidylglycerol synthase transmembrane domain-containing protein [Promethearchaeota archaeon]
MTSSEVYFVEPSSELFVEETEFSLRQAFDKKTLLLLSFAVIVLFIYLYLGNVSIFTMLEIMLSADLIILVSGAFFTFIAILFDTLAWKILLGISSIRPSTSAVYRIQLASFSYGLLIPSAGAIESLMRIALGTKTFINERENRNATSGEILSSVVAHRLCGLIAFIPISTFVAFAMLKYFSNIIEHRTGQPLSDDVAIIFVLIISLLSILVIIFFILIAISPNMAKRVVTLILKALYPFPLVGRFAKDAIEPSEKIIDDFSIQFKYLAQNKLLSFVTLILAFFSQVAHWISIYLILHSIGIQILLDQVAAINFLGGTIDAIPVGIPGMAGLKEITLTVFLEMGLNLGTDTSAAGAILVQLVKFYFIIITGIFAYIAGKTRVTSKELKEISI